MADRRKSAGGASLTSSTPDALWSALSLRVLRPAAVTCVDLRRGRDLVGCSLSVPAGARLLLVSDPDASASTLLRVLAGLSRAEHGTIRIAGSAEPSARGWGRRVAYVGPEPGLYAWMTPTEALRLSGDLLGLSRAEAVRRAERAIDWTSIPRPSLDRPMARGGPALLQRTALAAALIGEPAVLLLDEPLRAIDASERAGLLRPPGKRLTVLIASRSPAGEEGVVDHVAYLRNGKVALVSSVASLASAGLPLTREGIAALADRGDAAASPAGPAPT